MGVGAWLLPFPSFVRRGEGRGREKRDHAGLRIMMWAVTDFVNACPERSRVKSKGACRRASANICNYGNLFASRVEYVLMALHPAEKT